MPGLTAVPGTRPRPRRRPALTAVLSPRQDERSGLRPPQSPDRAAMPRRPPKLPALPENVVTHPAQLVACLEHLAQVSAIGFDTEFVGEDAYRPELCLVQVATAEKLYVIDPFACGPLDRFWEILTDPGKTVVVHAGREDVRLCHF